MTAILLFAIPAFLYGMGIAPVFSIYFLASMAWLCIGVRVLALLAIMGSDKRLRAAPKDVHFYVWAMHVVSIFAMIFLFSAGFHITMATLAITSVLTFIVFVKANFFQTQTED